MQNVRDKLLPAVVSMPALVVVSLACQLLQGLNSVPFLFCFILVSFDLYSAALRRQRSLHLTAKYNYQTPSRQALCIGNSVVAHRSITEALFGQAQLLYPLLVSF